MPKAIARRATSPTNPAHAQDTQRLSIQLGSLETFPVPLPGRHRGVGLRQMAGETQQKGEGLFGGAHRVARRGVHDDHPTLCGRLHIHIVHPDSCPPDRPNCGTCLKHRLAHLRLTPDHQGVTSL